MKSRRVVTALVLGLFLAGCQSNTGETVRKLVASGNEYYEEGRYREAAIMFSRAVKEDRLYGEAYSRLGHAELRSGRYVEAVRALHRSVELNPEKAEDFATLCEIYLTAARRDPLNRHRYMQELRDLITTGEKNLGDGFQVLRIKGLVDLLEEKHESAVEHLRRALEIDPSSRETVLSLVRALTLADRVDEAEVLARAEIEKDPSFAPMYDRLYIIYVQQGRDADAGELVRAKCEANPSEPEYQLQFAAHYHRIADNVKRDALLSKIESRAEGDAGLLSRIGDFYEQIGDANRAIGMYRRAADAVPEDSPATEAQRVYYHLRVAETMAAAGRAEDALAVVDKILELDPENPYAVALSGAIRLHGGDLENVEEAISELESVIAKMPDNAVLRYNLGLAYLSINDIDKARVQFQEAAASFPNYQAPRYQLGLIYLVDNQPAMAAQLADEVLEINSRSVRGRLLRAQAAIQMQELNQARGYVESVIEESPTDPDAQYVLASLNVMERRWDEAEKILRRLYENSPQDSRGIRGLISLYVAQGRPERAQAMLERELANNPESTQLRMVSAQVAMKAEDYDTAIEHYGKLLSDDPAQTRVHTAIALAFYKQNDWQAAEDHLREATKLQPGNWQASLRLSMLLGERGKFDEAGELLEDVLDKAPNNPIALNNMAYILAESPSTLDTAQTLAQRAVSRAPGNGTISETLGWIYVKKNLYDSAIPIYDDLVQRYPNNVKWRYRYAMALAQKGDRVRARQELLEALTRRPPVDLEKQIRLLLDQVS